MISDVRCRNGPASCAPTALGRTATYLLWGIALALSPVEAHIQREQPEKRSGAVPLTVETVEAELEAASQEGDPAADALVSDLIDNREVDGVNGLFRTIGRSSPAWSSRVRGKGAAA
ncbi:hypothetical protein [Streptomyces olindensis]|uniref:hypothetical protein n=1 Tax=Streptomyces olindensis TaxID=358823 RepID=UPI00366684B6